MPSVVVDVLTRENYINILPKQSFSESVIRVLGTNSYLQREICHLPDKIGYALDNRTQPRLFSLLYLSSVIIYHNRMDA